MKAKGKSTIAFGGKQAEPISSSGCPRRGWGRVMLPYTRNGAISTRLADDDRRGGRISDDTRLRLDLDSAQMRMARQRGHVVEFREGDVGARQDLDQRRSLETREGSRDEAVGPYSIAYARDIARKTRIRRETGIAEKVLAEAAAVAEQRMKEKFPEIPSGLPSMESSSESTS